MQLVLTRRRPAAAHWLADRRFSLGIGTDWQQIPDVHGDTLAFLQYTSGSTGTPKGVMLTHANLMHNSASIAYAFEHTRSGCGVFWLPSYHDMGLIGGILQPMYYRPAERADVADVVFAKAVRWLQAITQYRARSAAGRTSPTICALRQDHATRSCKTLDLSSWALAFNGAEPVRAETLDDFSQSDSSRAAFAARRFIPATAWPRRR